MHSPAEVRKWQVAAKFAASHQMNGQAPFVGMLEVVIRIYLPPPKSMPKKNLVLALSGALRPITRPDLDNYSKAIMDSLTGVAWLDDAQVVDLHLSKLYSEKPRVEIEVRERLYPKGPEQKELL